MDNVEYAVLSYYPSYISNENITIGLMLHNLTTGKRTFKTIKNFKRLAEFDNEIEIHAFKALLQGIEDQVQNPLFRGEVPFDLAEFKSHFVNNLRFGAVEHIITENMPRLVEELSRIHMRLDYD